MASHAAFAKLGRYQVMRHLARGGMADVLLAKTTTGIEGFARHVVLKRIRQEQAHDEVYVSMFLDEARLAASLHHQNIVQVTDIGEASGEFFFTMEYVHGEDSRSLLAKVSKRRELVPLEHVLSIVCGAAAGLHHAHEQRGIDRKLLGIVHRDVSPANILVGYDGAVKIADFGIAKASHRTVETASGTLKGKVAYMSPEQAVGEAVDRRSDVFSLGIVMYELLTVRRLFKGENDFLTMTAIVLGYIPPASELRRDLPPEIEAILMKALANKPDERYASAEEMRLALEQVAAKLQLSMSSTGLSDYMKSVFGNRPLPWLDDHVPDFDDNIDFDGSKSGVARAPTEGDRPREETRQLGSGQLGSGSRPPMRARTVDQPDARDLPEFAAELVSVSFDELESSPSIIELIHRRPVVQPAREPEIPPLRIGRTIFAFVALVALGVAIYFVRREAIADDLQAVVPPAEIVPVARPSNRPPLPTGATEPARFEPVVEPAKHVEPVKLESARIDPVIPADAKKPKPRSKPAPPPAKPAKRWDPSALFIE